MRAALAGRRGASGRMARYRLEVPMRKHAHREPACIIPLVPPAPANLGEVPRRLEARRDAAIDPGHPPRFAGDGGPALGELAPMESPGGRLLGAGIDTAKTGRRFLTDPAGAEAERKGCRALARSPSAPGALRRRFTELLRGW
jgi:hypothetical protein